MGIMVYSLLWVMQDFVHQQYLYTWSPKGGISACFFRALAPEAQGSKGSGAGGFASWRYEFAGARATESVADKPESETRYYLL